MEWLHLDREICDYKVSCHIAGNDALEVILKYDKDHAFCYKLAVKITEEEKAELTDNAFRIVAGKLAQYMATIQAHTASGMRFREYERLIQKYGIEWEEN